MQDSFQLFHRRKIPLTCSSGVGLLPTLPSPHNFLFPLSDTSFPFSRSSITHLECTRSMIVFHSHPAFTPLSIYFFLHIPSRCANLPRQFTLRGPFQDIPHLPYCPQNLFPSCMCHFPSPRHLPNNALCRIVCPTLSVAYAPILLPTLSLFRILNILSLHCFLPPISSESCFCHSALYTPLPFPNLPILFVSTVLSL